MSLSVNIAGQWTSTTAIPGVSAGAPVSMGINQDGWTIGWRLLGKTLRRTDKFGDTPIERFFSGVEMSVSAVFHEWKAQELAFLTVTNDVIAASGVQTFDLGLIGSQATDTAAVLVLSSIASTPARVNSFTTITFHAVSVEEDFPFDYTLGPDKAIFPFRGIVWPVTNSSAFKFFTTA